MGEPHPPYFHVERSRVTRRPPGWHVRAVVTRADTSEPVERFYFRAATSEEADRLLDEALAAALAARERPADWGRDPTVPRLVLDYLRLNDALYGTYEAARTAGPPDRAARFEAYHREDRAVRARLRERVEALTEAQRIELATATPAQLADPSDPHVLDLLSAKKFLCGLLSDPSPAVRAGYEEMHRALNR